MAHFGLLFRCLFLFSLFLCLLVRGLSGRSRSSGPAASDEMKGGGGGGGAADQSQVETARLFVLFFSNFSKNEINCCEYGT